MPSFLYQPCQEVLFNKKKKKKKIDHAVYREWRGHIMGFMFACNYYVTLKAADTNGMTLWNTILAPPVLRMRNYSNKYA